MKRVILIASILWILVGCTKSERANVASVQFSDENVQLLEQEKLKNESLLSELEMAKDELSDLQKDVNDYQEVIRSLQAPVDEEVEENKIVAISDELLIRYFASNVTRYDVPAPKEELENWHLVDFDYTSSRNYMVYEGFLFTKGGACGTDLERNELDGIATGEFITYSESLGEIDFNYLLPIVNENLEGNGSTDSVELLEIEERLYSFIKTESGWRLNESY